MLAVRLTYDANSKSWWNANFTDLLHSAFFDCLLMHDSACWGLSCHRVEAAERRPWSDWNWKCDLRSQHSHRGCFCAGPIVISDIGRAMIHCAIFGVGKKKVIRWSSWAEMKSDEMKKKAKKFPAPLPIDGLARRDGISLWKWHLFYNFVCWSCLHEQQRIAAEEEKIAPWRSGKVLKQFLSFSCCAFFFYIFANIVAHRTSLAALWRDRNWKWNGIKGGGKSIENSEQRQNTLSMLSVKPAKAKICKLLFIYFLLHSFHCCEVVTLRYIVHRSTSWSSIFTIYRN